MKLATLPWRNSHNTTVKTLQRQMGQDAEWGILELARCLPVYHANKTVIQWNIAGNMCNTAQTWAALIAANCCYWSDGILTCQQHLGLLLATAYRCFHTRPVKFCGVFFTITVYFPAHVWEFLRSIIWYLFSKCCAGYGGLADVPDERLDRHSCTRKFEVGLFLPPPSPHAQVLGAMNHGW